MNSFRMSEALKEVQGEGYDKAKGYLITKNQPHAVPSKTSPNPNGSGEISIYPMDNTGLA